MKKKKQNKYEIPGYEVFAGLLASFILASPIFLGFFIDHIAIKILSIFWVIIFILAFTDYMFIAEDMDKRGIKLRRMAN